jgi:cytochrome c2
MKKSFILAAAVVATSVISASPADVKETWKKACAKCHGLVGQGDTKMGKKLEVKDFTDAKVQASLKDEAMFKAIKEGVKDGERTRMKAAEDVNDEDINALVALVRSLKK